MSSNWYWVSFQKWLTGLSFTIYWDDICCPPLGLEMHIQVSDPSSVPATARAPIWAPCNVGPPMSGALDGMNHRWTSSNGMQTSSFCSNVSQLWTDAKYDAMIEIWNMSPSVVGSCQLPVSKAWLYFAPRCDALQGSNGQSGANVKTNGMRKGSAVA